jgi:hypothetical protein
VATAKKGDSKKHPRFFVLYLKVHLLGTCICGTSMKPPTIHIQNPDLCECKNLFMLHMGLCSPGYTIKLGETLMAHIFFTGKISPKWNNLKLKSLKIQ